MNHILNTRFKKRKIDVLLDQAPIAIHAGLLAALISVLLFWSVSDKTLITGWFGLFCLICAARYYLIHRFKGTPAERRNYHTVLLLYLGGAALVGLLWAVLSIYVLETASLVEGVTVLLIAGGIVAGSIATNTVILPAFFAITLPAVLPVIVYLLMQDSAQMNLFGGFISIFTMFLSYSAWRLNKLFVKSLSYQFDNLQLLKELEQEKDQITRLYSNLEYDLERRKKTEQQLKIEKQRAEELAESLMAISTLDGLTGIPNRRHFDATLAKEWNRATRSQSPLSVIMCDIDFFKPYNDHYGHQKGDKCLMQIATILQENARRDGDIAARYGGEEFIIILPATSLENAHEIAEQMRIAIENLGIPHRYSETNNVVTASFGVATTVPVPEQRPGTLVARADKALYRAKLEGRNRVVDMEPELYRGKDDGNLAGEQEKFA